MKKVVYLHGLNSTPYNDKVKFLSNLGYEVFAPHIFYEKTPLSIYNKIERQVKRFNPDFIIGSSMGGYFAYAIGSRLNKPVLLFNPANVSENRFGILVPNDPDKIPPKIKVILGQQDDVIDPVKSKRVFYTLPNTEISEIDELGHRIPVDVFINQVKEFIKSYDS